MEMIAPPQKLWEGKVSEKLKGPRPHQVWPLLRDFFNLHKWLPTLATCRGLEGVSGEPGCVRYCSGSSIRASNGGSSGGDGIVISWSIEKLVSIDDAQRSFSYEMMDSNIGFKSYRATMKVVEEDGVLACVIEWSFEVEPVEGLKLEDLVSKYQLALERIARRIEDTVELQMQGRMSPS